jgi:hypothetical protein
MASAVLAAKAGEIEVLVTRLSKMIPLVSRIMRDIMNDQKQINDLNTKKSTVAKEKVPDIGNEVNRLEERKTSRMGELFSLNWKPESLSNGSAKFHCLFDDRSITFSWKMGEGSVMFWHWSGERFTARRPISELKKELEKN